MGVEQIRATYPDFYASPWEQVSPADVVSEAPAVVQEKVTASRNLVDELRFFQTHGEEQGLKPGWEKMMGTGFSTDMQMGFLKKTLHEQNSSLSRKEIIQNWSKGFYAESSSFAREYLMDGSVVYPISLDIEIRNGRKRVVNTKHGGGKLLADTVSKTERNGSVYDVLTNDFEPFFLDAPDGSVFVYTSPEGDSGMKDDGGNKIIFPHSMTFVCKKQGEGIVGYGIQTDFKHKTHRALLKKLTGLDILPNASDEIYVRTSASFRKDEEENHGVGDVLDVIDIMEDVRKESPYAYADVSWERVRKDIAKGKKLWEVDEKTQGIINEFVDFTEEDTWGDYHTLQQAMAVTIFRLARHLRGDKGILKSVKQQGDTIYPISLGDVFEDIKNLPGCAGGGANGKNATYVETMIKRFAVTGENSSQEKVCGHCGNALECGVCIGGCSWSLLEAA